MKKRKAKGADRTMETALLWEYAPTERKSRASR